MVNLSEQTVGEEVVNTTSQKVECSVGSLSATRFSGDGDMGGNGPDTKADGFNIVAEVIQHLQFFSDA